MGGSLRTRGASFLLQDKTRQLKSRARPSASDLDPDAKSQWGACAALGNARVGAEYLNPSGTKGLIGPGTFVLNTCSCNWP
jgi:hypothetical protein